MNLSRILRGLKLTKWRQLPPSCCTALQGQGKQLLLVEVSPNPRPLSLPTAGYHHCGCGRFLGNSPPGPRRARCAAGGERGMQHALSPTSPPVQLRTRFPPPGLGIAGGKVWGKHLHTGEGREVQTGTGGPHIITAARSKQRTAKKPQVQPEGTVSSQSEENFERRNNEKSEEDKAEVRELDEAEVRALCELIVRRAAERDVMARSVAPPALEKLVEGLNRGAGWSPSSILALLASHPSLLQRHCLHALLPTLRLLESLGFSSSQARGVVERLGPVIVQASARSQIMQSVDALRQLGFGQDTLFPLLRRNPALLLSSPSGLAERVAALKELFKTSDVIALGIRCPPVMSDPWKDVQSKFDYVFHEMVVTQRQMVHAALFNHPLLHIKARHTFVVRAGLYSMTKRRQGEKNPNAPLDQIVDTSDREFCRRFGGFQVAEYRAFCALFEKEQATLRRMQGSDSDDDDS